MSRLARVIVVDDDRAYRILVAKLLQRAGHTVLQAEDGAAGLDLIQSEGPDLVLTDLMMPTVDGWEVVRRLRSGPDTAGLTVVAVTAHAMVGDRERVLAAGFDGYITKPIAIDAFVQEVDRYLDEGRTAVSPPVAAVGREPGPAATGSIAPAVGPGTVLVVDDLPQNVILLQKTLKSLGYEVITAGGGAEALTALERHTPDVVLTDVMMPGMDGFELCRRIKGEAHTRFLPVVLVTALSQLDDRVRGIEAGADDFLSKPFNREELVARTRSLIRLKRAIDQLDDVENVIRALASAVEAKDQYTEQHTERVARYAVAIGQGLRLSDEDLQQLRRAGFLHDVGKIAVPEAILSKPGPLDDAERAVMEQHPAAGERICLPLRSAVPLLGAIRHHHERFDGQGYPDGLQGNAIPLHARIMAVADAFDAMTSDRPYRKGLAWGQAAAVLRRHAGAQWDPEMVSVFLAWLDRAADG